MEFRQVKISTNLSEFFGENFKKKWNLVDYYDINQPAIFFGVYTKSDRSFLQNHKSKSLIIWGGSDLEKIESINLVKKLIDKGSCYTWVYPGEFSKILENHNIKHKKIFVPIKKYDEFQTTKLGDKIYVYKGIFGNREKYFKWNEIIKPIINHFGEERVLYTQNETLESLKNNFYQKSFVYVKPNEKGGCTTMFEMAHMGRKTLGLGFENNEFFTNYENTEKLLNLLEVESQKIGKINYEVSNSIKNTFISDNSWLYSEYYG
jgi:L-rhamnose mutarotase